MIHQQLGQAKGGVGGGGGGGGGAHASTMSGLNHQANLLAMAVPKVASKRKSHTQLLLQLLSSSRFDVSSEEVDQMNGFVSSNNSSRGVGGGVGVGGVGGVGGGNGKKNSKTGKRGRKSKQRKTNGLSVNPNQANVVPMQGGRQRAGAPNGMLSAQLAAASGMVGGYWPHEAAVPVGTSGAMMHGMPPGIYGMNGMPTGMNGPGMQQWTVQQQQMQMMPGA
jgi:hypothetical protein